MQVRPVAFIQVDLDGLWAVRRCYGCKGAPEQDDPVYGQALGALLDLFDRLSIKATFFVVGADAQVAWKRRRLEAVVERGHEIANHSMSHSLRFARLSRAEMEEEIGGCREVLSEALGVETRGFRAPGYGFSPALVEVLESLGLWYDASMLPTPWGCVMRWIDRRISVGPRRDKSQYGASVWGWSAPLHPFRLNNTKGALPGGGGASLFEIPVSVTRRLRMPFHGGIGYLLGRRWVDGSIRGLARRGYLNYVLHGMDVLDGRLWGVTTSRWGKWFFGGSVRERLDFFTQALAEISRRYEIVRTDQWVERSRSGVEND